jgi:uncharacterized radical SAM superfamily Fe-S cluster-containing enzyme
LADGGVWFHKECPGHGPQQVRVYSDAAEYLELGRYHRAGAVPSQFARAADSGCPNSCGLCPDHEQHVCMPIIEITDHCNLACPVCLVKNRSSFHLTPDDVQRMLDSLVASEGQIDVLNLSGGEPTLNPQFREIVDKCLQHKEILRVSVSTNGLALLDEPSLFHFLAERNVVVSLQFDGQREGVYETLRGQPLLQEKMRIIDLGSELDAPMSLTATVAKGVNDDDLDGIVRLLFERDNILSAMFQPAAYVGTGAGFPRSSERTTIPDVIRALDWSYGGRVSKDDFSPLPCSHPACFSLAFYLRVTGNQFVPVKRLLDIDRYLDIIQNRALFGTDSESFENIRDAVYALWSGPAALAPDSRKALAAVKELLKSIQCCGGFSAARVLAAAERSIKSVFIHHFMDRDTFDLARARKCCNVYPLADGRLMPACVYNCLRR